MKLSLRSFVELAAQCALRSFPALLALLALVPVSLARAQDVLVSAGDRTLVFLDLGTVAPLGFLWFDNPAAPVAIAHAGSGIFHGVQGSFDFDGQPAQLVRIDARTASRTVVGSIGMDWAGTGVALDPVSGNLYAYARTANDGSPPTLFRIDTTTAVATPVVTTSAFPFPRSLMFDAQGRALVLDVAQVFPAGTWHPRLQQIDLATGQVVPLGTFATAPLLHGLGTVDCATICSDGSIVANYNGRYFRLDPTGWTGRILVERYAPSLACVDASDVGLGNFVGCTAALHVCPCPGGSIGNGCTNTESLVGALLRVYGTASIAHDSVQLAAVGMPNVSALFFQGTSATVPTAFGDGLLCAGGLRRIGSNPLVGGALQYPTGNQVPVSVQGQVAPGVRVYQALYRDPMSYCTSATFNLTNSVVVQWVP